MTDEEIIERGFVPWKGGYEAPSDWDGGEVLARNGETWEWDATDCGWVHSGHGTDFIGYRRKQSYPANLTPELAERMVELVRRMADTERWADTGWAMDARAIMAELEPVDPFVECFKLILGGLEGERHAREYVDSLRAELAKRNPKIVESTDD